MLYDRLITITTGNNRKSVNWQPQVLMLSEFYEKLRIPTRSTETMDEQVIAALKDKGNMQDALMTALKARINKLHR